MAALCLLAPLDNRFLLVCSTPLLKIKIPILSYPASCCMLQNPTTPNRILPSWIPGGTASLTLLVAGLRLLPQAV